VTLSGDQAARFIRNLQNAAKVQKIRGVATVTQVTKNDQGMPVSAIATVGRETNVTVSLANGIGTITHPGETWIAELEGGATGKWRLVECVNSRFLRIADQTDYELPTPQIPDTEHGGLYTESAQAGVGTPNASPDPANANAVTYLYYWTTLPGSYSAFDQGIRQVAYQVREEGFEEWERTQVVPLYPNKKIEARTTTFLSTSGTAVGISVDSDLTGFLLEGQPAYWRINNEVILGTYTAGTIGIVDYTGPGSAVRGEGFTFSTGGRAQPQGGALGEHTVGSLVELMMGQLTLPALRPAVNYEVQVAFVNQANRSGPWSTVQSFTSWSQDIAPAAPSNLTVEQYPNVINATWSRVVTDADGNPRGDIKRYAVARHTASLAATATFAAVAAVATIFAGTANPIANTSAQVPSTFGYGNYIGVAAISDNGLVSDWSWADDDLAPPYPAPGSVTITSIPNGVFVSIPPGADSRNSQTGGTIAVPAQQDPGFYQFVLWRADTNAGGSARIVGYAASTDFPVYMLGGVTGYYKVTAMDRAGNFNGVTPYPTGSQKAGETNANTSGFLGTASGWQFVWARHIENTFPLNGAFQDVIGDESAPRYWIVDGDPIQPGAGLAITFDGTAGITGNRAWKIQATSYTGPGGFVDLTSDAVTAPAGGTPTVNFWVMSPTTAKFTGADTGGALGTVPIISVVELSLIAYNSAGSAIGSYTINPNPVGGTVNLTANTWKKVSFTGTATAASGIGATAIDSLSLSFQIWPGAYIGSYSAPVTFTGYVDSVEVTWN